MNELQDPTQIINNHNIEYVRRQIEAKKSHKPYIGTIEDTLNIVTDMDHNPYTRFYRGIYNSHDPVVFEREAGWRAVKNNCYRVACNQKQSYPNHCWESACSTTYPCYPEYLTKYSDKKALDVQLNNACIVQYR